MRCHIIGMSERQPPVVFQKESGGSRHHLKRPSLLMEQFTDDRFLPVYSLLYSLAKVLVSLANLIMTEQLGWSCRFYISISTPLLIFQVSTSVCNSRLLHSCGLRDFFAHDNVMQEQQTA